MEKMYVGVLYAVKQNKQHNRMNSIIHFMSNYTGTPKEQYTVTMIERILYNSVAAMLNEMEYPGGYFLSFMQWKEYPWNYSDFEAMCAALAEVPVKTKTGEYINGFIPLEEFDD